MRSILCAAVITSVVQIATGQDTSKPITHRQACERFSKAIVQVDTDVLHGTGFVADPDGYIVTAFHVIADMQTMRSYGNLTVTFEKGDQSVPAQIVSVLDAVNRARDFAILKIDKSKLFSLALGNEDDAPVGSQVTIIGLPLSAAFPPSFGIVTMPHFCLPEQ
jgi:serine protease Do